MSPPGKERIKPRFWGGAIDNAWNAHIVGDMEIKLCIPPESATLKAEVKRLRDILSGPSVQWDPLAAWFGNKIPQSLGTLEGRVKARRLRLADVSQTAPLPGRRGSVMA